MAIRLWARPERRHPSSMKAPFLFVAVATAFSMAVNGFTLREAELDRQMKDAKVSIVMALALKVILLFVFLSDPASHA